MHTLLDFLTFKQFITADILMFFYYVGVFIFPLALYLSHNYLKQKLPWIKQLYNDINITSLKKKLLLVSFFILLLTMMELLWRMMFEMIIGYFQMHNYLQILVEA
jgi:hypothetical protein